MSFFRIPAFTAVLAAAFLTRFANGQNQSEPDATHFKTMDGLSLFAKWYDGGKSQKSDTVILVHGYGSDSSKGPWEALAKALQKEGYSVLLFDMRGHGKSTDFKVFDDKELFVKTPPNITLAGVGKNIQAIKDLKMQRFSPNYYPYLVNDLAGARLFVDGKHDIPECNTNRIFVITEKESSPLVMMWLASEFARQGNGPSVRGAECKRFVAGKDIAGVVFLSWGGVSGASASGQNTALSIYRQIASGKVYQSETEYVHEQIKKKVAMAFVFGNGDAKSNVEANSWFRKFGIPVGKKDDAELVKYMVEVAGAEKLTGVKLLDLMEEKKDDAGNAIKVSVVEGQILTFLKKTKQKGINGSDYLEKRYSGNIDWGPFPIENGKWMVGK